MTKTPAITTISYIGNVASRGGHIVNVWFDGGPIICQYILCKLDGEPGPQTTLTFEHNGIEYQVPAVAGKHWTQWKSRNLAKCDNTILTMEAQIIYLQGWAAHFAEKAMKDRDHGFTLRAIGCQGRAAHYARTARALLFDLINDNSPDGYQS